MKANNKLIRVLSLIISMFMILSSSACTKSITVPPGEYAREASSGKGHWVVQTKDQRLFAVKRFSVDESSLVLEELDDSERAPRENNNTEIDVPYVLDLEDVASVDQRQNEEPFGSIAMIGVLAFVGLAVWQISTIGDGY